MALKLSDFDYHLPRERVASFPPEDRTSARLYHIDKRTGVGEHRHFRDLVKILVPGDLLVLNNTKVLPARLFGRKMTGGRVEALLLKALDENTWKALIRPGKRVKKGMRLVFGANGVSLQAEVLDEAHPNSGERLLGFEGRFVRQTLQKIGHIPLPPYLDRSDTALDRERYQTVFAREEGAVASPTAGLHFDQPLLKALQARGVEIAYVTLHVSYGTFQPLTEEDFTRQQLFEEEYEIGERGAAQINRALCEGRRIVACGTTSVRALESAAHEGERGVEVRTGKAKTRLFIYPPYHFKVTRGLITNFHLPRSSLLLLVAAFLEAPSFSCAATQAEERPARAFSGQNPKLTWREIYEEAVREKYRFYSYGDAMVIL